MDNIRRLKRRSTSAVDSRHLKIKEKDTSLTKNDCVTIRIQKISLFDKFIPKIHPILWYHELKGHGRFGL